MTYDPEAYWQERGKAYRHKEQASELGRLAEWVREIGPATMLEVGAGTGRVYADLSARGLASDRNYIMCDFVDSFRLTCRKATGRMPVKWDGVTLPFHGRAFDLVISFSVMLHVLPDKIAAFIAEHVRVTREWLFVATWYQGGGHTGKEHNFEHDYPRLFEEAGLVVVRAVPCGKGDRVNWLLRKRGGICQ